MKDLNVTVNIKGIQNAMGTKIKNSQSQYQTCKPTSFSSQYPYQPLLYTGTLSKIAYILVHLFIKSANTFLGGGIGGMNGIKLSNLCNYMDMGMVEKMKNIYTAS
jgi:hypothetical protein